MPPHYRIADLEFSRAGHEHVAAYSRLSTAAEVLTHEEAALLRHCRSWLPLEEHAKAWLRERQLAPLQAISSDYGPRWLSWAFRPLWRYAEQRRESVPLDGKQIQSTQARLEQLASRGFLVAAENLIEQCRSNGAQRALPPIASIGITTRRRTEVLRRGLVSHFENRRQYARSTDYVIIDDATDAESQTRTRAMLLELRREFGVPVRYAGLSERRAFARALIEESGAPSEVVEFALFGLPGCPITTGAARNCLLLATAGDRVVMVDDDSMCRLALCPAREDGIAFSSRRDPTEFWFYSDPESTLRAASFAETDFAALHETLLGRTVGESLADSNGLGAVDLHAAEPSFDGRLRLWGGRVRATMAGVLGDSGIGATAYLFVDPESQKRLTRSQDSYDAAVRSRQVLRCVRRTTIGEGTSCIAVNLGLDNRSLLPPFIPVQRNSDGLFARTLRLCFRDGYLGYFPWAVLHDPEAPRQQTLDDYWRHIRQVRTSDVVIHLMQASGAPYEGLGDAAALRRLGAQFEDWGALDAATFEETLRKQVWLSAGGLFSAEEKRQGAAEQDFYARHRRKYADILRERVTETEYLLPSDLRSAGDNDTVRDLTREIISRFGKLLQAWPEIHAAAVRLRAKGVELAPKLTE